MKSSWFLLGILALAAAIWSEPAKAATHFVRPDGSGDFPTIQAALAAASNGDEIRLTDGTFRGPGNRDLDFLGKSVVLRSDSGDPERCVIDCEASATSPARGIRFHSGEGALSVVEAITIQDGHAPSAGGSLGRSGGGILCEDGTAPTITRCRLIGNIAGRYGGGICCVSSAASITWCTFQDNLAEESGGGLARVFDSPFGLVGNCTFYRNAATFDGSGVFLAFSARATVERTIVASNVASSGVHIEENAVIQLICSDIYGNEGGDWVGGIEDQLGVNGNKSADPLFCNAEEGNLTLDVTSPCSPSSPENPDCGLIGAHPVDCDVPVQNDVTWGRVRGLFR